MERKEAELRRLFDAPERDDLAIGEVRLALKNLETERAMLAGERMPIERTMPGELRTASRYPNRGNGGIYSNGEDREIRTTFLHWVRTGDAVAESEIRAYQDTDMNIGTPADGGVGVPTPVLNRVIARRDEMLLHPRLGATKIEGRGTTIKIPVDGEADIIFADVSEGGAVLRDAPVLGSVDLTLAKAGKYVQLSWELIRDEDVALESFLTGWLSRGYAGSMNSALVTAALAGFTAGLTLDASDAIGAGEIAELVGKLAPEYQDGAQWIMHNTTHAHLAGKSGNPFQFAPTPGASMNPNSLWGYPLNRSSYMPEIAGSAKSLLFADFEYLAYRDGGLTLIRDPYSASLTGQVNLVAWYSYAHAVTQAEGGVYGTHATA